MPEITANYPPFILRKEWKKLRNKYLDMQRKCVRQIRMNSRRQYMNENRFGSSTEKPEPQTLEVKPEPCPEFEPGLIVKIILDEPISDAKRFKVNSLLKQLRETRNATNWKFPMTLVRVKSNARMG